MLYEVITKVSEVKEAIEDDGDRITSYNVCYTKLLRVNCATPKGRKPTRKEINCCRPYIENIIEELKPNVIILLGDQAIESQFNGRFKDLSVTRWRGLCVPEVKNNAWVVPLMHPAHVVKMKWDAHLKRTFRTDLKYALSVLRKKEKPEVLPYQEHVHLLTTMGEIRGLFDYLKKEKPLSAYDWETSRITSYNVCYTKLLRWELPNPETKGLGLHSLPFCIVWNQSNC